MATNPGKIFEEDIEKSCKDQKIFYHRIKDVHIPHNLRMKIKVTKNKFDNFIFKTPYLVLLELKSTKGKSISFSEGIIKQHQIDYLQQENNLDENIIAGFIFNFREYDNQTFFVYIEDFIKYKNVAEGLDTETTYKSKINKSSISLDICKEIGVEIQNTKKVKRYRYYMNYLIDDIKIKYYDIIN